MIPRRNADATDASGFTVVELLVAITIVALILVPLAMALLNAMDTIPESGAQTRAATDRDRLMHTFSDEVSDAQLAVHQLPGGSQGSGTKELSCPAGAMSDTAVLYLWWADKPMTDLGAFRQYFLRASPGPDGLKRIDVLRQLGADWDSSSGQISPYDRMITGYCSPGAPMFSLTLAPGSVSGTRHETVEITLILADTRRSAPRTTTFSGRLRIDS